MAAPLIRSVSKVVVVYYHYTKLYHQGESPTMAVQATFECGSRIRNWSRCQTLARFYALILCPPYWERCKPLSTTYDSDWWEVLQHERRWKGARWNAMAQVLGDMRLVFSQMWTWAPNIGKELIEPTTTSSPNPRTPRSLNVWQIV